MTTKRAAGALLNSLVLAAALGASSMAQADVLTFEDAPGPIAFAGSEYTFGNYWVQTLDNVNEGDMAGNFINGADQADICFDLRCPVNNQTGYLATLNDGYFAFGLTNGSLFTLDSMRVSFIGTGQTSFPVVSGLLILAGFDANFNLIQTSSQIAVGGPGTNGQFSFANANLGAFADTAFAAVRVLGYACNAAGSCSRAGNAAAFAFDDIVTTSEAVAVVPEPASWLLIGLGLLGLGAVKRKRAL